MAVKTFIPTKKKNNVWILGLEKHLLNKHYEFLDVKVNENSLTCTGSCKPSEHSILYTYQIKYTPDKVPNVYVINPQITYHDDIHMYPFDNSLCLYYPKDFSWSKTSHLYNTIVPWTHEWFIFYELYQIYGKWFYPFVPHKANQKIKNYGL